MNILQMMMGACGVEEITWENWDETSEATLASDDIFVCLMENVNAGGDETGRGGGLTGADLVLTQTGNIAGMSDGHRTLDGTDDYFTVTTAFLDALIANVNNTWTIILKVDNITLNTDDYFLFLNSEPVNTNAFSSPITATDKYYMTTYQNSSYDVGTTTDSLQAATEYYICIWADGTDMRMGFTTTRPTKWSDFGENDRVLFGTNTGAFSGLTFDHATYRTFFSAAGTGCLAADFYYMVMSKTCLIDNDL